MHSKDGKVGMGLPLQVISTYIIPHWLINKISQNNNLLKKKFIMFFFFLHIITCLLAVGWFLINTKKEADIKLTNAKWSQITDWKSSAPSSGRFHQQPLTPPACTKSAGARQKSFTCKSSVKLINFGMSLYDKFFFKHFD